MHNRENRPKKGGICVANHTSPIDIVILANDGCYAMVSQSVTLHVCRRSQVSLTGFHSPQVGQVHGGLMGVIQRSMVRSCPHVWFERSEMKDRHAVAKRCVDLSCGNKIYLLAHNIKHRFCFFPTGWKTILQIKLSCQSWFSLRVKMSFVWLYRSIKYRI